MFWIERSEGPSNRMAAEQEAEKATLFQEAVTRTRQQQEAQAQQTPPQPPQTQADNPPAAQPVLPQSPPPTPNGTVIHKIRQGDTTTEIGGQYGFSVEELGLISPGIEKNPDLIFEGDTLVLPTRKLFDDTKAATKVVEEAAIARRKWDAASTVEKEAQARALLTPGFLEATKPVVHDEAALRAALDTHATPILNIGRRQPGFDAVVRQIKDDTLAGVNELYGPLRPAIAMARQTGDWAPVRNAALTRFKTLAASNPAATVADPDSMQKAVAAARQSGDWGPVRGLLDQASNPTPEVAAQKIASSWIDGGPGQGSDAVQFSKAITDARNAFGAERRAAAGIATDAMAAEVVAAAPPRPEMRPTPLKVVDTDGLPGVTLPGQRQPQSSDPLQYPRDYRSPDRSSEALPPELVKLEQFTQGMPAGQAASILDKAAPAVDKLLLDLPNYAPEQQRRITAQLAVLADRAPPGPAGEFTKRTAAGLAQFIRTDPDPMGLGSGKTRVEVLGETFETTTGSALSASHGPGFASPRLGIEVTLQLQAQGQDKAAKTIGGRVARGIDQLREQTGKKGDAIASEILYPAHVAGQALRPDAAAKGLEALARSQESLIEDTNRYGGAAVLARQALLDVPPGLLKDDLKAASDRLDESLKLDVEPKGAPSNTSPGTPQEDALTGPALAIRASPAALLLLSRTGAAKPGQEGASPGPGYGFVVRQTDDLVHAFSGANGQRLGVASKGLTMVLQAWGAQANLPVDMGALGAFGEDLASSAVDRALHPGKLATDGKNLVSGEAEDIAVQTLAFLVPDNPNQAFGIWFAANSFRYSAEIGGLIYARGRPPGALEKGAAGFLGARMPSVVATGLEHSLPFLTFAATVDAAKRDPVEGAAWLPSLLTSWRSPVKLSAVGWFTTAVFLFGKALYDRRQAIQHYEKPLGTYLRAAMAGGGIDKTSSLAKVDEEGRPFLERLPAIGKVLGYNEKQLPDLVDWLYRQPPQWRDMLVSKALSLRPNGKGEYAEGEPGKYHWEFGQQYWPEPKSIWDFIDFAAKNNTPLPDRRQRNG